LIARMLTIIVETMNDLSLDERVILGSVNAHAMLHTFGTQPIADEVPVDVVQKVLGHLQQLPPSWSCLTSQTAD
jgi:hypothetical protein